MHPALLDAVEDVRGLPQHADISYSRSMDAVAGQGCGEKCSSEHGSQDLWTPESVNYMPPETPHENQL